MIGFEESLGAVSTIEAGLLNILQSVIDYAMGFLKKLFLYIAENPLAAIQLMGNIFILFE